MIKIIWQISLVIFGLITIWFAASFIYLYFCKKINLEDALEINIEKLIKLANDMDNFQKNMQKEQLKNISPELEFYVTYYKSILEDWLRKIKILK